MCNKLETLSVIMDENEKDTLPVMQKLYLFREQVDSKLIPSIEKVQYIDIYKLIDYVKKITTDISLYLYFPSVIGKKVYGVYHPNKKDQNLLRNMTLTGLFSDENAKEYFSRDVPTLIYPNTDDVMVSALNISENILSIDKYKYLNIVDLEISERLDIGSLLHFIALPSSDLDKNTAYLIIPVNADEEQKYYSSILKSIDTLIICNNISTDTLSKYPNVKQLVFIGAEPDIEVMEWAKERNIKIDCSDEILRYSTEKVMNNFEFKYKIENVIFEIQSYLAQSKMQLSDAIKLINNDLTFKDDNTELLLKEIKNKNTDSINSVDNIYGEFRNLSDNLISIISDIENDVWNNVDRREALHHDDMCDMLLDLIIKMCMTFMEFPVSMSRDIVRDRINAYIAAGGNKNVSNVLYNDFTGTKQNASDLSLFSAFPTNSKFLIEKKLDMSEELNLSYSNFGQLILKLPEPIRPSDRRKLGEYYHNTLNNPEEAKKMLVLAMEAGDEMAGNLLMSYYKLTYDEIHHIAEFGNAAACYYIAKAEDKCNYPNTFIYLIIAAAKGYKKAVKALGHYYYNEYTRTDDLNDASKALRVYSAAYQLGLRNKTMIERMASILLVQKDYKAVITYCDEAQTPYCNYMIGFIFENGKGCSVDKEKALKYYEKAAMKGNPEAQVKYERLNDEIASEKEKNVVQDDTDYSAKSTYGGYYTSYSGW